MEGGLGTTRMGSRSSTRHGPASVFQGRVRRWRKSWAPVVASPSPSAAASRVLLYKWTPLTLPTTNGTKESTPEEPVPAKPVRFLPVSVVLQQRKEEEAQKASDEAEYVSGAEQETQTATNSTVGAEISEPQQGPSSDAAAQAEEAGDGGSGSGDEGLNGSEPGSEGGDFEAQARREELAASLQEEGNAEQEPESASMELDHS